MLTDSGGFQVMSLSDLRKVSEAAVTFRSHIDGTKVELSPERSIEVQLLLGSDIAMQMDECVRLPAERADIERAMALSLRWGERSLRAFESAPSGRMLFGIAQGGDVPELRRQSARGIVATGFHGYAIGGLAVGEPQAVMLAMLEEVAPHLPTDQPRYLMGVGTPEDLLEAVRRGMDMFDCVMPTRNGRHGVAFTRFGADQHPQRQAHRRPPSARRGKQLAARAQLFARLSQSSRAFRRDARRDAAVGDQYRLLPVADGRHQGRDRDAALRRVLRTDQGWLGARRHSAALGT